MENKNGVAAAVDMCACEKDGGFDSAALWLLILALLSLGGKDGPERDLKADKISYLSGKVDALEDLLYGRKREGKDGDH